MKHHSITSHASLKALGSTAKGLTATEVEQRLKEHGRNEIKLKRQRSILADIIEPFKSAFVLILILASGISLLLGKKLDAIVIIFIVVVNAIIYYVQRLSADRAMKALSKHDERKVKVLRDGKLSSVEVAHIVPGDIILLAEGMKVPADGRLIGEDELLVDESALTGESLPVEKHCEPVGEESAIYDQQNMVFQGTFVSSGLGRYVVTATGNNTEMAKIAELSREEVHESPLQRKIDQLTGRIIILAVGAATLTFGLGLYRGIEIGEMLRFALSLTVSAVPESLPIALTVVLVFGIKRMAKKNALVRNLTAVETLGQTTLIATDKTGTLTKNELAIAQRWHPTEDIQALERIAWLSLTVEHGHADDPLEQVLFDTLQLKPERGWKRTKVVPFDQRSRMSGAIWKSAEGITFAVKGAPEAILNRLDLPPEELAAAEKTIRRLMLEGYRLIAFGSYTGKGAPHSKFPEKLELAGILAFADQLRPEIPKAIQDTHDAGIQVVMVTGDHIETARTFGKQAGIIHHSSESAEGRNVESVTLTQLRLLMRKVRVFARVLPEHKHKILDSLHKNEITAMTGDGVNDVPAIVKADVGLAMGNGTDAAKEAADVILLDSNYATIVEAIREGRTILANVRKMAFYLFSTNLGEVLTMIGALVIGLPLPLTALHVLWINLVTDGFTVIPLGLEPHEDKQMQQPPEKKRSGLLSRPMLLRVLGTASFMAAITLTIFWLYLPQGLPIAQTMAFATLVVVQWANALNARSDYASFLEGFRRPNYKLWGAIAASAAVQATVFWGPLQGVLGVTSISSTGLVTLSAAVIAVLIWGDLLKKVFPQKI